ncbi:MAG TPA: hypothetical protein ENK66_10350 [Arcobacter sp.]|jgi:general secretion pathway protein C|nr:hypothetical protein [Arcobacter sp.]
MSTLYKNFFKFLYIILLVILLAYLINLALYFYLPKKPPVMEQNSYTSLEYIRYDIKQAFKETKVIKKKKVKEKKKKTEYQLLSNITLIAIFDLGNGQGVITIAQKGKNENIILGIDEEFQGYILKEVYKDYVIFEKNNNQYRVALDLVKEPKFTTAYTQTEEKKPENEISFENDEYKVKREYMNSYINDFSRIWKDINIQEYKIKGKIDGFKIGFIKKGSAFEKLGLKKGDIIKSVNNIKLKSYNDAFKLYNNIDKTTSLNILIQRDNQEMEINYEIQ